MSQFPLLDDKATKYLIRSSEGANSLVVITHDGRFHADEIMACAILLSANTKPLTYGTTLGEYGSVMTVFRTRNIEEAISEYSEHCERIFVVDMGNTYDHANRRYDHHQNGFTKTHPDGTLMASAGLIWDHYGKDAILLVLSRRGVYIQVPDDGSVPAQVREVHDYIRANIIRGIDARDNGYGASIDYTTLSDVVSFMNPTWKDGSTSSEIKFRLATNDSGVDTNDPFKKAVDICRTVLEQAIWHKYTSLMARDDVAKFFDDAKSEGKEYAILGSFRPWIPYMRDNWDSTQWLRLVIFQGSGKVPVWMVQTTLLNREDQQSMRTPTPPHWRGLRDADLAKVTGVPDAVFAHKAGFLCGARSLDGAVTLAEKILAHNKK